MKNKPFSLKAFLIDLLFASLTLAIIGTLSALLCILLTGNRQQGLTLSLYFSVPLIPMCFFTVRRQFNWRVTIVQTLLLFPIVFSLLYLTLKLVELIPIQKVRNITGSSCLHC